MKSVFSRLSDLKFGKRTENALAMDELKARGTMGEEKELDALFVALRGAGLSIPGMKLKMSEMMLPRTG
jgi:hypothetical protein